MQNRLVRSSDLKVQTEALICSAREQVSNTNYVKHHIARTAASPLCIMYSKTGESVCHVVGESKTLAQKDYKRHDKVARIMHCNLCEL